MPIRPGMGGRRRFAAACAAIVATGLWGTATQANASVAHVVQPGETLWSIAYANNLTTRTVAVFNGLSEDAMVVEGQTVNVPTVDEGAAALASAGITPGSDTSGTSTSSGGAEHTVVWGESLWSVATANGISVEALAAANGLAADAYLIEGQTITVPAAGTSAPPGLAPIPGPLRRPVPRRPRPPASGTRCATTRSRTTASTSTRAARRPPTGRPSSSRSSTTSTSPARAQPANPPGTSTHESGIAVDVAEPVMRDVIDQIGGGYGWSGTIPSEWWHVEYGW